MNWNLIIKGILDAATQIQEHHAAANPDAAPLTNEQVHGILLADLQNAQSNIAAFFVENGLPLPE